MSTSRVTYRAGMPRADQAAVRAALPVRSSVSWMERERAAAVLGVNVRTVDRYIRQRRITSYTGPIAPTLRRRVFVWAADVDLLQQPVSV
jgi:hypothetical protein